MALSFGVYRYENRDATIMGRNVTVLRRSYPDPLFLPHDIHCSAGTGAPEQERAGGDVAELVGQCIGCRRNRMGGESNTTDFKARMSLSHQPESFAGDSASQ